MRERVTRYMCSYLAAVSGALTAARWDEWTRRVP